MKVSIEVAEKLVRVLDKREDLEPGRFYSFPEVSQIMSDAEIAIPDDVSLPQFLDQLQGWDWIESNGDGFELVEQSFRITAKGQYRAASSVDYAEQFNQAVNALPSLDDAPIETKSDKSAGIDALSAQGIETAPPEVTSSILDVFERVGSANFEGIPAADRIVRLDHNSPEYREITNQIADLTDAVRSSNQVGDNADHRDQLLKALSAATELWAAAQLKVIQIKIGIIMAIEDAYAALTKVGKAVGFAMIVDGIKSYVKNQTGIDV